MVEPVGAAIISVGYGKLRSCSIVSVVDWALATHGSTAIRES
jgi:hypothetical protein